ncbi:tRNA adenylyltransferase KNAG_0G01860 [Huiozyma naganishii CBS 8797]|uniref:CCA tRNA nucleotidyltransferase, mitochondrial n=1 Tax=Huiozyma naganishii (strain ATCC MYA-139 / BCRC 22969 / CBS 8797 / KCTC 17520 / NBRC 10181 / NCYC 3082 / Yp74L-3) TaxID=1071383 RepID=J7RNS5_HUIN7|nr:hypothetical protein KNAG_0G01860 [Kazachstania naganishii CBS 8797]CCK71243.1 hypothetical protein KNAG_0G01860 [Kazachstania naganishii CBS 8797]
MECRALGILYSVRRVNCRAFGMAHRLVHSIVVEDPTGGSKSPLRARVPPKLILNKTEHEICNLLKDYCNRYNSKHADDPLVLRITGGWVRDKLLGQGSHDLDIAINNMSGESFAQGLNQYLTENYAKYGVKPHSVHKIDKNPEKSKHLETATTKLFGVEVDFVNLRSEEYTELSRIPVVNFGTPEEDALRRDATLNALFYNIQTENIEDFTKRGLQDLQDGVLRTPLPPRKTFLDDPLRVLRLIRFASRFKFTIQPDVLKEMADAEINNAFYSKISRERVGVEMEKILLGPNPLIGWELIQRTHLENVIFFWHCTDSVIEHNRNHLKSMNEIDAIYKDGKLNKHMKQFIEQYHTMLDLIPSLNTKIQQDANFKQNFFLASSLTPFKEFDIVAFPKKKMNNTIPFVEAVVRDGLKIAKSDAVIVSQAVAAIAQYSHMVTKYTLNPNSISRSDIGLFMRTFKGHWELAHYVALVTEYLEADGITKLRANIISEYNNFFSIIHAEHLDNCHDLKPLVDGKRLQKELEMRPGPWMGKINDEAIKWQLDNPSGTETQLLEHIKSIINDFVL